MASSHPISYNGPDGQELAVDVSDTFRLGIPPLDYKLKPQYAATSITKLDLGKLLIADMADSYEFEDYELSAVSEQVNQPGCLVVQFRYVGQEKQRQDGFRVVDITAYVSKAKAAIKAMGDNNPTDAR
tara:strand:- start:15856 stop:16239 length:384 start_codon:yes stop_codon:yes gene_type:complete